MLQYFKKHLYIFIFLVCFIYFTFPNTFIFFLPFLPSLPFLYIPPGFLTKVSLSNRSKIKSWIFFLKRQFLKIFFWEPKLIQKWFYIISIPMKVIVKLQIRHELDTERPCLPNWSKRKSIFGIISRHYNLAKWILNSFPLKTQAKVSLL